MDAHALSVLRSIRSVVEADDDPAGKVPSGKESEPAQKRKCPLGFKFDGRHCVPSKVSKSKGEKPLKPGSKDQPAQDKPPPSRRTSDEGDFPNTRDHDLKQQTKDIPLVPDPDHEVMQQPYNAVTYSNGMRSFEYAEEEWKEYAHNSFIQVKFPDAFADKAEFINEFLHGQHVQWEDWQSLQNCSAANQEQGDYQKLLGTLWGFKGGEWGSKQANGGEDPTAKEEFKNYLDELIEKASKEEDDSTPPIIIGVHKDDTSGKETNWLIAGNTRATVYAFIGKPAQARLVELRGRMLPDPTPEEQQNSLWPAEQSSEDEDEIEQNVRAAVQQVIQARGGTPPDGSGPGELPPEMQQQPPQESVWHTLKAIFTEDDPAPTKPQRKYPSGHQKRMFQKTYKTLGYPIGTVRNWERGQMVKTAKGWEDLPPGVKSPKPAAAPVPAASHDKPVEKTAAKEVAEPQDKEHPAQHQPPFPTPKVDPSLPSDKQDPKVFSPPEDLFPSDGHWIEHIPGFPRETTDRHYSGWKQPKKYRQKLHDSILGKIYEKVPAPSEEDLKTKKPVAIMLMGGPASGKSTIGNAYPDDQFVHLDADALKEHIPEYKVALKWRAKNAAKMAHEESIHLMQQLREKTIAAKKNLVMDGTGRHIDSYLNMIKKLKGGGYHVKVVMADIDHDTALRRAKDRGKTSGRWVPGHVFSDAYRDVPRNSESISNAADEFELWDTRKDNVPELKWDLTDGKETVHDPEFVEAFREKHGTGKNPTAKAPVKKLEPPAKKPEPEAAPSSEPPPKPPPPSLAAAKEGPAPKEAPPVKKSGGILKTLGKIFSK